ncbi:hypothetical protein LTR17_012253 [Elasticomyces elasticus]|nr:hypothetical protein LTR17_012253 [Elasticomyces elasticus]
MASKRKSSDEVGEQPTPKKFRPAYLDNITILAGPEETPLTVHQDIICAKSDFFKAACSETWTKGKESTIQVRTVETDVMKLYIHWTYKDQVCLDIIDTTPTTRKIHLSTFLLFKLYVAADMFLDTALKNAVTDQLVYMSCHRKCFATPECYNWTWENTSPGASLRKLILDISAARASPAFVERAGTYLSKEYLLCLSVRLLKQLE